MPMWIHRPTADFFIVFCDFSFMLEYVTCTYVSPFSSLSLPYIDPPPPPLCLSQCSLVCAVLWPSTLLNCISPPIDYFNGGRCYTVGLCVCVCTTSRSFKSPGRQNGRHTFTLLLSGERYARPYKIRRLTVHCHTSLHSLLLGCFLHLMPTKLYNLRPDFRSFLLWMFL